MHLKNTVLLSLIALFLFVKYNVIMFTQHRFQLKSENFLYNLPFHLQCAWKQTF